ncbi:unnamed protein product [Closterium sp. NIES-65]|nr:unnamed protein product [Closterium sp. NIES-65]
MPLPSRLTSSGVMGLDAERAMESMSCSNCSSTCDGMWEAAARGIILVGIVSLPHSHRQSGPHRQSGEMESTPLSPYSCDLPAPSLPPTSPHLCCYPPCTAVHCSLFCLPLHSTLTSTAVTGAPTHLFALFLQPHSPLRPLPSAPTHLFALFLQLHSPLRPLPSAPTHLFALFLQLPLTSSPSSFSSHSPLRPLPSAPTHLFALFLQLPLTSSPSSFSSHSPLRPLPSAPTHLFALFLQLHSPLRPLPSAPTHLFALFLQLPLTSSPSSFSSSHLGYYMTCTAVHRCFLCLCLHLTLKPAPMIGAPTSPLFSLHLSSTPLLSDGYLPCTPIHCFFLCLCLHTALKSTPIRPSSPFISVHLSGYLPCTTVHCCFLGLCLHYCRAASYRPHFTRYQPLPASLHPPPLLSALQDCPLLPPPPVPSLHPPHLAPTLVAYLLPLFLPPLLTSAAICLARPSIAASSASAFTRLSNACSCSSSVRLLFSCNGWNQGRPNSCM